MLETLIPKRAYLYPGNCLTLIKSLPVNSIDSVVTDPPYGLEFMGKDWDGADGFRRSLNTADVQRPNVFGRLSRTSPEYRTSIAFQEFMTAVAVELLRVLKPGAHLVMFGGTRTYHRMACAVEDAGFEIRDQLQWLHGQGMPKGKNLDGEWKGWGTGLKPASEPIVLARKSLSESTASANVLRWRVGALNIVACKVGTEVRTYDLKGGENLNRLARPGGNDSGDAAGLGAYGVGAKQVSIGKSTVAGRWPANVLHDGSEEVLQHFPQSKGQQGDVRGTEPSYTGDENTSCYGEFDRVPFAKREDVGSAARFFYCAKATKAERDGSKHPTIKPLALMRWLVRLVTPPNGFVLDPFAGTGTTGAAALLEGFRIMMAEADPSYAQDIRKRILKSTSPT